MKKQATTGELASSKFPMCQHHTSRIGGMADRKTFTCFKSDSLSAQADRLGSLDVLLPACK